MSLLIITDGKISDSLSTVPITHLNDVTASRALLNNYTNATGKTLFVSVGIACEIRVSGDTATAAVLIDGVNLLNIGISVFGGVTPVGTFYYNFSFFVPLGAVYRINPSITGTGNVFISPKWIEQY